MFGEYGIETETKHAEKEKYLGITEKTLKTHKRLSEQYRNSGKSFSAGFGFPPPHPSRSKYMLSYLSPPCAYLCAHTILVIKKQ